ncbi:hypothetical protein [Fervidobacterium thailandense]|uniref:LytR family transcriptional regulator n=1 Tax=Fervidobacterium thailandense TaxID=1008305 RepID=A0A1E3G5M8_9BACT|nr:hypothetical protein [Fervidobacterium thailandense]ODN31163.1 hypothetical protein A4H02_02580 [Fervidobacterium thailandense]
MRTRPLSTSKRKKEGSSLKVAFAVVLFLLLGVLAVFGLKIGSVRNSEEFAQNKISAYYFYTETDSVYNHLIIVNGEKRSIHVVRVPSYAFFYSKKLGVRESKPRDQVVYLNELLNIKPTFYYVIPERDEFFKRQGVKNVEEFLTLYSKRGLKLFDYFRFEKLVSQLRPDSNITAPGLAKLYDALGRYGIQTVDIPTLTKLPIKITVGNQVFIRHYVDEEGLENLRKSLQN